MLFSSLSFLLLSKYVKFPGAKLRGPFKAPRSAVDS